MMPAWYMHPSPPSLGGGHLPKLPRPMIILIDGQLFHPGEQGLHQATKPCWVLATHKLSLFLLVTYPPPAVTPQVSTNLGPVARLEQPFLVWHSHATCESCTVQKNGCHTAVLFLRQCWLLTPVGEIVAWRVLQICSFCTSNMPVEILCKKYWFQKSSHLSTVVFTFSNKVQWHNCSYESNFQ